MQRLVNPGAALPSMDLQMAIRRASFRRPLLPCPCSAMEPATAPHASPAALSLQPRAHRGGSASAERPRRFRAGGPLSCRSLGARRASPRPPLAPAPPPRRHSTLRCVRKVGVELGRCSSTLRCVRKVRLELRQCSSTLGCAGEELGGELRSLGWIRVVCVELGQCMATIQRNTKSESP
eukprot:gene432-biopygen5181